MPLQALAMLGAILRLAEDIKSGERPGGVADVFEVQIKMDAGTCQRLELLLIG